MSDHLLNPCDPCCGPRGCHPRWCWQFINQATGEPIQVDVDLDRSMTGVAMCRGSGLGLRTTDGGSTWCYDPCDLTGDPSQPYEASRGAWNENATVDLWVRLVQGGGAHACEGYLISPPGSGICLTEDDDWDTYPEPVPWPLCCEAVKLTVNTPPIPHHPSVCPPVGGACDYGVGTATALVDPPDHLLPGGTPLSAPGPIVYPAQCYPGLLRLDGQMCGDATTRWTNPTGPVSPFPGVGGYVGENALPVHEDTWHSGSAQAYVLAYTSYQKPGYCTDDIHRIWGPCQGYTHYFCDYSEVSVDLTEHGGSVVPSAPYQPGDVDHCQEPCAALPHWYGNEDGTMLCAVGGADTGSLTLTMVDPQCGFSGGTVNFDCAAYTDPNPCLYGGPTAFWHGCVAGSGPSRWVPHFFIDESWYCPAARTTECYDGPESVKSYYVEVYMGNGTASYGVRGYHNAQCQDCVKCTGGQVLCNDPATWRWPACGDDDVDPLWECSGLDVPDNCATGSWPTVEFSGYGVATGPCGGCVSAGGCASPVDPGQSSHVLNCAGVTCESCGFNGFCGKLVSANPLLIEFYQRCGLDWRGNRTYEGDIVATLTG